MIRKTPGCVCNAVAIGNEAYNRLYAKMKSVNTLLAWGHARVIENLLVKKDLMNPPPVKAISDQFAASKSVVEKALMSLGKELQLNCNWCSGTRRKKIWRWPRHPSWRAMNL
jgi:ribonuclease HIII